MKYNNKDYRPLVLLVIGITLSFVISSSMREYLKSTAAQLLDIEAKRIQNKIEKERSNLISFEGNDAQIDDLLASSVTNFFTYTLFLEEEVIYKSPNHGDKRPWTFQDHPIFLNGNEYTLRTAPVNSLGRLIPFLLGVLGILFSMISALFLRSHLKLRQKSTALIRNEEELKKLNHRLSLLNQEAEQYIYIASHDLQEPLNTINSFIEVLHEDHPELQENPSIARSLNFMSEASDRMKLLIKALLQYSKIGEKEEIEEVETEVILQDVLKNLHHRIIKSRAEIHLPVKMPRLLAYKSELTLLFQNLISNALKYHRPNTKVLVRISSKETINSFFFSIQDNGIGISEKHFASIFKLFHRLHNKNSYTGHGIGLAHCKKIIDLHGGKIWVRSTPNGGSTFCFEIPKR